MMTPKFYVVLEQALMEGIRRGYHRAYKHTDEPKDEQVIDTIYGEAMNSLHEYFDIE